MDYTKEELKRLRDKLVASKEQLRMLLTTRTLGNPDSDPNLNSKIGACRRTNAKLLLRIREVEAETVKDKVEKKEGGREK